MKKSAESQSSKMFKDYFYVLYSYCPPGEIRCDCNQEENFTCKMNSTTGGKRVCYPRGCKC